MSKLDKRKQRNRELEGKRNKDPAYEKLEWREAVRLVVELVSKMQF